MSKDNTKRPFWHKKRIIFWGILLLVLVFLLSFKASVIPTTSLSPSQAAEARKAASRLIKPLMSSKSEVSINVSQGQLESLSHTVSYTVPALQFRVNSSAYGVFIGASFTLFPSVLYLNTQCMLLPDANGLVFSDCKLGSIPIPGMAVNGLFKGMAWLFFGEDASTTYTNILANATLSSDKVTINFSKPENLKASVESRITEAFELVQSVRQINGSESEAISFYLDELKPYNHSLSSAELIGKAFALAKERSVEGDPVDENYAALWALAIMQGTPDFARMVALPVDRKNKVSDKLPLRGRQDLRLHFFFSVAMTLASEKELSINVGKLKEILDTSQGGSGYSFRDLTADKAGTELAHFATQNDDNAILVQSLLANTNNENIFIPELHDLPEGFSETRFKNVFGDETSQAYQDLENIIDQRIAALPLYRATSSKGDVRELISRVAADSPSARSDLGGSARWITVDTHIHSKHSDGKHSIEEVAKKAATFGCDAIAITDHGDRNLTSVFSDNYFTDLQNAQGVAPSLTIIPGLEWNIPPLKGREHLTLLLPESINQRANLIEFRKRFDNYGSGFTTDTLTATPALQWLNNEYPGPDKPVILYNHPSRKDLTDGENQFDFIQWHKTSPFFSGFSGAPGHQKKRGDDNGSYNKKFRTVHGWDPSIAVIGRDWDQVLQTGLMAFGARAPSDFHNTNMDYWPCEFSTTHILANSSRTNAILAAMGQGHYWAQHGKFIESLSFTVNTSSDDIVAINGEQVAHPPTKLTAKLNLTLAAKDWQGFTTRLDEVTAVVITENNISTHRFDADPEQRNHEFTIPIPVDGKFTTIRWFGRSIQPEQHHYQFFSNPIKINWSQ